MNKVLIIDDRVDFVSDFAPLLKHNDLHLIHQKSFEGLKKAMPQLYNNIIAVILDINCLLTDDQEMETPDFIGTAMTYLDQNYPKFPRVILTGDDQEFNNLRRFYKNEFIYLKTPEGKDLLLTKLKEFEAKSEELRIKRAYPSAFEVFENQYLSSQKEQDLLSIFKNLEVTEISEIKKNIGSIRTFLEPIYIKLNALNKDIVPDEFISNGKVVMKWAELYLAGVNVEMGKNTGRFKQSPTGKIAPDHICYILSFIKDTASAAGNHDYKSDVCNYTLKSLSFALLELLVWFNQKAKELSA